MTNEIHPTVIIEGDVKFGKGNRILPYTILIGPLEIGDDNIIGPLVTIGSPGQDTRNPRYDSSKSLIRIGSGNIIRENTAIQKPCYGDLTSIGDRVYLMHAVHIPHDATIEDDVVITPSVVLGGCSRIMRGANLAMGCTVHQYAVIGPYSIVATGAAAVKNLRPFSRFIPGKEVSLNLYPIEKHGFEKVRPEIERYFASRTPPTDPALRVLTDAYEKYHRASGRAEY